MEVSGGPPQVRVIYLPSSRLQIEVRPWLGNTVATVHHFNAFGPATCVQKNGVTLGTQLTDVRIGGGSTAAQRFIGAVDNVNVYSGSKDDPGGCVVVP